MKNMTMEPIDNNVELNDEGKAAEANSQPPMTLTVEDLMRELHISKNTAYALTERKGFPVFRIGKRKLINRDQLQEWMNRQTACAA